MKHIVPSTRAEVLAVDVPLAAKAILCWLLDQPPRVFERAEVAAALGSKQAHVEVELVRMQRRVPVLLSRNGPDGAPIRGRHAFIPADSPLRAAWAVTEQTPPWERPAHPGSISGREAQQKRKKAANG